MFLISLTIWNLSKHSPLGHKKSRKDSTILIVQLKETLWCVFHAIGLADPYYLNNETVRGVDFYQIQDTCFQLEAQNFPQIAFFQQYVASTIITRAAHSHLGEILWNLWIERYGSTNLQVRSPNITTLDFSL